MDTISYFNAMDLENPHSYDFAIGNLEYLKIQHSNLKSMKDSSPVVEN